MASTASLPNVQDSCLKMLSESPNLNFVPSEFTYVIDPNASNSDSLPVIDFSLLTSLDQDQRSKALQELHKACEEWGFFVLINHGIQENLLKAMINTSMEYFELSKSEKQQAKHALDPIISGNDTMVDTSNHRIKMWRDFVKTHVHPEFHAPDKPETLKDLLLEYSQKTRWVARKLLEGISDNLGLEKGYIDEALKLDECFQLYASHLYTPCPQPDRATGLPPHTDHGLLTFLIHNGVDGLQVLHKGEWFKTNFPHNSILVNTADHLEIFSNGKYKSVKHRAVVNNHSTRLSVVISNCPGLDAAVGPAAELVRRDGRAKFRAITYKEYIEINTSNRPTNVGSYIECLKIEE